MERDGDEQAPISNQYDISKAHKLKKFKSEPPLYMPMNDKSTNRKYWKTLKKIKRIISHFGVWKMSRFFSCQLWSEASKKQSPGVCKGNFVLIVKTNSARPVLRSPLGYHGYNGSWPDFIVKYRKAGTRKNTMKLYQRAERGYLVLLIVTDSWQWTERRLCEPPFIPATLPYGPQPPAPLHPGILWNMYKANRGGVDAKTFLLYD